MARAMTATPRLRRPRRRSCRRRRTRRAARGPSTTASLRGRGMARSFGFWALAGSAIAAAPLRAIWPRR
eukprot:11171878-Lingulodinium_polyedra.AAC.1